ncbi:heavy metal translocating P-type ATPase [Pueribacillus sp. YX66]|uniref:heavy metal translocating P-type ATPase n=1 Tax=Pueribacillus sp. YX66 TaxID=3229242 RepID=UPI00358CE639
MKEYKVKGLSCPNCTLEMESKIKELDHAGNSQLSYTKGKLIIHENVNLTKVQDILSTENAVIIADDEEHTHIGMNREKWLLIGSATLFFVALTLDFTLYNSFFVIPIYLTAMVISGYKTFIKGLRNLVKFTFTIDTLMTVALIGAVAIGEWKEGTLVAILFGLNEYLEGLGMEKARNSVEKLLDLAPKTATMIKNGMEKLVPVESLQVGDVVLIKAGETIPSDGVVIEGKSSVNEAAITGESLPVEKESGESLFGGSINNEGILKVKVTKAFEDSSLAKILHLVENAQETKTPTELFINRFAKYYTPFIMIFAALVTIVPPLLFELSWEKSLYQGLAVLIVGCPCALILSSPIANISGITRNARNGILVKGSVFLELLGKLNMLVFDKTGTLTKGEPHVEKTIVYDDSLFYPVVAAIEKKSTHPLAKAIMQKVEPLVPHLEDATNVRAIAGQGLKAVVNGESYWVGNEKNLQHLEMLEEVKSDIQKLKKEGLTLVIVASERHILGIFGISDEVRPESRWVIQALDKVGIHKTVMLTGDHEQTANKVAKQVGMASVYSNLLPEQKAEKIKKMINDGNIVGMVGDGINDAPALATANVGIAMGKGTDSAIDTADVVLMQDHLGKLPSAIRIARRVNRLIKINISIALSLKAIALLLTIPGLLTLWIAILSDMGATIIVTILSLTVMIERKHKT